MKIGDPIIVRATTSVGYDADGNRDAVRDECVPFKAVIIGHRTKMLGKIGSPLRGGEFGEYYEPACLRVSGSVGLWEIRHGLTNSPMLVADDDFDRIDPFDLLNKAALPRYKCTQ